MYRDAWVEVNLEHLAQNVKQLKGLIKDDIKLMAVVKADAYGHGAVMTAPTMLASGVDVLGVASIDEGLSLRDAKINCEILVLGAVPVWALESAVENDISISIFSEEHIIAAKQAFERTSKKVKAHIKIDTGMNRIGVGVDEAINFIKEIHSSNFIDLQGIFTHLACAEDEKETELQLSKWDEIISQVDTKNLLLHVFNTAGMISYKIDEKRMNMVRAGIGLYGLFPDLPKRGNGKRETGKEINLTQIMSLKGRITNIHVIDEGGGVSYGHTFIAKNKIKIATIPIGYADGIPRALSNKIFGMINGKKVPQIGNITMDQMMFDITDIDTKEGDIITLLGYDDGGFISIDEWAKIVNTINYELTCRLKVRLPRVYTR